MRIIIALDNFIDRPLARLTAQWTKRTGLSNFVLARVLISGFVLLLVIYASMDLTEGDAPAFVFLAIFGLLVVRNEYPLTRKKKRLASIREVGGSLPSWLALRGSTRVIRLITLAIGAYYSLFSSGLMGTAELFFAWYLYVSYHYTGGKGT